MSVRPGIEGRLEAEPCAGAPGPPLKRTWRGIPRARARRPRVRIWGRVIRPLSISLTVDVATPERSASSCWLRHACPRANLNAMATFPMSANHPIGKHSPVNADDGKNPPFFLRPLPVWTCGATVPAMDAAERLRALRGLMGLSQAALAARSGVDQSALSNIETGATKRPQAGTLAKLMDVLRPAQEAMDEHGDFGARMVGWMMRLEARLGEIEITISEMKHNVPVGPQQE